MNKKILTLTTGVYLALLLTGLSTAQSTIAAAGIILNALVAALNSGEFRS